MTIKDPTMHSFQSRFSKIQLCSNAARHFLTRPQETVAYRTILQRIICAQTAFALPRNMLNREITRSMPLYEVPSESSNRSVIAVSGYRWLSVVMAGYQWFLLVISCYRWLSVVIVGYQLLSLVISGYRWLSVFILGYQWLFLVISGYRWLSLVILGYQWLSLVISGYV